MIKDIAFWNAWESQGPLREHLDPLVALKLGEAMYEHARLLGAFPPADPLEGIETKIALARIINVRTSGGADSPTEIRTIE